MGLHPGCRSAPFRGGAIFKPRLTQRGGQRARAHTRGSRRGRVQRARPPPGGPFNGAGFGPKKCALGIAMLIHWAGVTLDVNERLTEYTMLVRDTNGGYIHVADHFAPAELPRLHRRARRHLLWLRLRRRARCCR